MKLPIATIEEFCSERSELAAYIDGELMPREEMALEMHLAMCADCRDELNEQKKLLRVLDSVLEGEREIEMPADFTRVVVANAESRVSGLRRPQERFKALFVCAALFGMVVLGLGSETRTVFGTFARFAEQFLAVGGFVWTLIYDIAFGTAIVLRSLSHQVFFHPTISLWIVGVLFLILFVCLSRFAVRLNRS